MSIGCVVACFAPLDPPGGDSAGVAAGGTGSGGGGTGRCDSISSSSARSNLRFFGCCRGVAFWVTGFSDAADDAAATVVVVPEDGPTVAAVPGPVLTATTVVVMLELLLWATVTLAFTDC